MSDRLVCKPSPWFLFRAFAMLAMFSIFAVLFFMDAKWGYKEKNYAFVMRRVFDASAADFNQHGSSRESWNEWTRGKTIDLAPEAEALPDGTPLTLPLPKQLTDYDKMKGAAGNIRPLYDEFRGEAGIKREPEEHGFDRAKIFEQWVVFCLCTVLAIGTLYFLIRTLRRTMAIDDTTFYPAGGAPVPISDLTRLDLRKWDTKGVAFAWTKDDKKLRIDGFVYGGFKKDQGEPAEALMKRLKASFSGEILQYVTDEPAASEPAAPEA